MQYHMDREIPHLTFKHRIYKVQRSDQYDKDANGQKYVIIMEGVTEVPQCFIEEHPDHPFEATLELKASKLRTYAESLWWESIPMEMLYTEVMKPQVRVKVDGLDAICSNRNCDYLYKEDLSQPVSDEGQLRRNLVTEPLVTGIDFSDADLSLIIDGSQFVDRMCGTEAFSVSFAGQSCAIES